MYLVYYSKLCELILWEIVSYDCCLHILSLLKLELPVEQAQNLLYFTCKRIICVVKVLSNP
jgi:hypothetical protein